MSSAVEAHVLAAVREAERRTDPFAHVVIDGLFPADFYAELLAALPADGAYTPLVETGRVGRGYSPARWIWAPTEAQFAALPPDAAETLGAAFGALKTPAMAEALISLFADEVYARAREPGLDFGSQVAAGLESFLIRDHADFELGPHTDSPRKLVSALLYLPPDAAHADLGTSFYRPKDPDFRCPGGPHHEFADFERVATVPYAPNTFVAFAKSDIAFHGVERVASGDLVRDILFLDVMVAETKS